MKKEDYKDPQTIVGRTVKVIKNTSRHNRPIGTVLIITRMCVSSIDYFYDAAGVMYYAVDIELVPQTKEQFNLEIKEIKKNIKELEKQKSELDLKIQFMISNKIDEYNDNTYKTYSILQTLKGKKSDIEMAQAIADILK